MEDIEVTFPGGKRVDAHVGAHVVHTDQPTSAGGACDVRGALCARLLPGA